MTMNSSLNIVVYGWAFAPPTIWHHAVVQAILENMDIEKLLIVPSGPRTDKSYTIEKETRRRIIEVFASEFDDPRVMVDFTFLDSCTNTTTLAMDGYYQKLFGWSPFQVFGADAANSMQDWPNTPEYRKYLLREMPKIFLTRHSIDLDLKWKSSYRLIDADIPDASSTAVRENGRLDLLTEGVREIYQQLVLDKKVLSFAK